MDVIYLKEEEYDFWNEFVDESPEGSIYGKTWYLDALQVEYKILVVVNGKEIFAGIVLTKNEINTYSNPLLCKYLGIFFKNLDGTKQKVESKKIKLAEQIINEIKDIKTFDYTFHPNFKNWLPYYWNGYKQTTKYSYRISLIDKKEDEIFKNFTRELRNRIKKFQKIDFVVNYNNNFNEIYNLIENTYAKQGGKSPFKKEMLRNIFEKLEKQDSIKYINVFKEYQLLSFVVLIYDKQSAYLVFHGFDDKNNIPGAHEFAIYEAIKEFSNTHQIFDFEGSMIKEIESFYRKFGGDLVEYYQIYKPSFINNLKLKAIPIYKRLKYGK